MRGVATSKASLLARVIYAGECWIWTGGASHYGYGQVSYKGKTTHVHRVAYMLWVGPIPDGLQIDHVKARGCSSKLCLNPAHLEAVTAQVNSSRANTRTHCPRGHEYTEENTRVIRFAPPKNPGKSCKICDRNYRNHGTYWPAGPSK